MAQVNSKELKKGGKLSRFFNSFYSNEKYCRENAPTKFSAHLFSILIVVFLGLLNHSHSMQRFFSAGRRTFKSEFSLTVGQFKSYKTFNGNFKGYHIFKV
jgi:hypothetical protein